MAVTLVHHICSECGESFSVRKGQDWIAVTRKAKNRFCSVHCKQKWFSHQAKWVEKPCSHCGNFLRKQYNAVRKSKNIFCSNSCSASYNNTHKTHGTRRSKLETWIEEQLKMLYPNLSIECNQKSAISSELDIYIPSLQLAFEFNGIYHYKPIHGAEKLASVKDNDARKQQACFDRGIDLRIIDTSSFGYFKTERAKKFLDTVVDIIKTKH